MNNYDVLIIGSGASGGMVAHTLTSKGIRCLMLDAGPPSTSTAIVRSSPSTNSPIAASASPAASRTSLRPTSSTPTFGPTRSRTLTPIP